MIWHRHLDFNVVDWSDYLLRCLFLTHHSSVLGMDCYLKFLICYYIKFVTDYSNYYSSSFHFAFIFTVMDWLLALQPYIFSSNHFYSSFLFFHLGGCSFLTCCSLQREVEFQLNSVREQEINSSCFVDWPCVSVADRF